MLPKIRLAGVPKIGQTNDVVDMAGREWRINTEVKDAKAQVPGLFQIFISVADAIDKDANLITLEVYIGNR